MAKKKTKSSSASKGSKPKGGASRSGSNSKAGTKKTPAKKAARASSKVAKKTTKKTSKKAATGASAAKSAKKTTKTASKPAKKTTKKPASSGKSTPSKKAPEKAAASKAAGTLAGRKPATKKQTKKVAAKPQEPPAAPETPTKAPETTAAAANGKPAGSPSNDAKGGDKRPASNRPKRVKPPAAVMPEGIGGLLSPGGPAPKPLIASTDRVEAAEAAEAEKYPTKSPFNKRELEKFRATLLTKRAEVLSEVTGLEGGALTGGGSGNLSHTPQHMADAGSDAAEQTLSLDLAAAERNLIKEIDAALQRIRDGVFGLCEATGRPIRKERLAELPWTRYSIDAARQLEGKRSP